MPEIQPIPAVTFAAQPGEDLSDRIAPPYDVLDEASKAALLARSGHNIVAIDLPYLPPKTVGPDAVYEQAGRRYRQWLEQGVLRQNTAPALFAYRQTFTAQGRSYQRRGLIANVKLQPFGPAPDGSGGIYPHEQTFASAKEDRLKLTRATHAQLSPIFGLYLETPGTGTSAPVSSPAPSTNDLLDRAIDTLPLTFRGTTADGTVHEVWTIDDPQQIEAFQHALAQRDIFIADGHHRYNTALNYQRERLATPPLSESGGGASEGAGTSSPPHAAPERSEGAGNEGTGPSPDYCLFVLVSMDDPGMIVLPTHRVLGNMPSFNFDAFVAAARDKLNITPVAGTNLADLERAVNDNPHPHALGLYNPASPDAPLSIATPVDPDPLAKTHPNQSDAWRQLDVALVQHLLVERICQPTFCDDGQEVAWKFPHDVEELKHVADGPDYQLGVLLRPTPLDSVRKVSEAGELMPQKSTFFYPKLATGLVINPLGG